jgi:hypothetical protein
MKKEKFIHTGLGSFGFSFEIARSWETTLNYCTRYYIFLIAFERPVLGRGWAISVVIGPMKLVFGYEPPMNRPFHWKRKVMNLN